VAPRRDPACIRDPASIKINVKKLQFIHKLMASDTSKTASTVAEICRGSQIFGCSPSPAPSNFGPKRCFWQATPRSKEKKWCKNFVAHVHV